MTLEDIAYLAEIIGLIVIVATLIYLAVQTRQNTDAIRTQSAQSILQAVQSDIETLMSHNRKSG